MICKTKRADAIFRYLRSRDRAVTTTLISNATGIPVAAIRKIVRADHRFGRDDDGRVQIATHSEKEKARLAKLEAEAKRVRMEEQREKAKRDLTKRERGDLVERVFQWLWDFARLKNGKETIFLPVHPQQIAHDLGEHTRHILETCAGHEWFRYDGERLRIRKHGEPT